MIERLPSLVFRWNAPDFVGSRRWWVMITVLFAVLLGVSAHGVITISDGWRTSGVATFCRRLCTRGRPVIEAIDPASYWLHMGLWGFATASCIGLAAMCLWAFFNRDKF